MRAFCFASGQIGFGRSVPNGAIVIARGPSKDLRDYIGGNARVAYPPRRGRRSPKQPPILLVPGVPEAPNQIVAVGRLSDWCKRISLNPPAGVRVLPR